MEHHGLIGDTGFWVLLSTLLFAVIAYIKGRAPLLTLLDSRTARIKAELEEAENLRVQAQNLLAETQRQHRDAMHTAERIIEQAKSSAVQIEATAAQRREDGQKRREEQLFDRIARAESAAIRELQHQAADLAVKAAEQLLREAMGKNGAALINEAINDIPAKH